MSPLFYPGAPPYAADPEDSSHSRRLSVTAKTAGGSIPTTPLVNSVSAASMSALGMSALDTSETEIETGTENVKSQLGSVAFSPYPSVDPPELASPPAPVPAAADGQAPANGETKLTVIEASKRLAAWTAVDHHILERHKVIGVGSGSTVPYVVERIVAQGEAFNRDRVFIPTGFQSKELIVRANLRLGDVDQYPNIDVTIDGADEVDAQLNCIKGGGACHLREKVLAEAAETWVVVADYRKNSQLLGATYKAGVPIEVAPFAYAKLLQNVRRLGSADAGLRMAKGGKAGPVVTDNGNFVIDAPFDANTYADPYALLTHIKMLTGVVEVGLFCHMAKAAYFGNADGSVTIKWNNGKVEQIVPEASPRASPQQ